MRRRHFIHFPTPRCAQQPSVPQLGNKLANLALVHCVYLYGEKHYTLEIIQFVEDTVNSIQQPTEPLQVGRNPKGTGHTVRKTACVNVCTDIEDKRSPRRLNRLVRWAPHFRSTTEGGITNQCRTEISTQGVWLQFKTAATRFLSKLSPNKVYDVWPLQQIYHYAVLSCTCHNYRSQ